MHKGILALLLVVVLTACGSSDAGLTTKDLAIQKVNDDKAVVKYGMSREAAEKVLGQGEKAGLGDSFSYSSGVRVMYRDDNVAGIYLTEESESAYETAGGMKVGMQSDEIRKIYGDQALSDLEKNLDYAYDSDNKQFIQGTEWAKAFDDDTKIYLISVLFDGEGSADTILLTDRQMAMTFR
ncbi:hypothetical protein R70723_06875 [Paenibacillus sp. FSL R7-0273]|uniref:hypothetical protein n=1 Tax=Paenibacillus sp. FSL R7-0273 TaxID=1536772 RepID=UPI0004F79569|nr:hypothetical protein [Paenibacillus sp. FSL R7-0273]AIQ45644.1 hypothetical protein R70723_06875 [Paenibacillus sp. FSL R7-0273]OMF95167.1 hypothetical protein BK144_06420 [Paenibacillus sp. FSL R7-0273]